MSHGRPLRHRGAPRSARVRPYSLTGGRTHTHHPLLVESFVGTVDALPGPDGAGGYPAGTTPGPAVVPSPAMPEAAAILELCRETRTVAEVAALLNMPLGVVRVLLSDLADQGRIQVYGTGHGPEPDRALLERVLDGLRRI